jgi:hypothetical protein
MGSVSNHTGFQASVAACRRLPAAIEGAPRCRAASETEKPVLARGQGVPVPRGREPNLCAEHARLLRACEKKDGWWFALTAIEEWIAGTVDEDPYDHLHRLNTNMLDEARTEYARVAPEAYAAGIVAEHAPPKEGEPSLTLEQAEELARLIAWTDSFVNAHTLVEDALDEVMQVRNRDALDTAAEESNREVTRLKEALGF